MFILPGNLRSRRPGLVALFDDPYRRSRPAPCGGGDLEGGDALRVAGFARKTPGFRLSGGARTHALRHRTVARTGRGVRSPAGGIPSFGPSCALPGRRSFGCRLPDFRPRAPAFGRCGLPGRGRAPCEEAVVDRTRCRGAGESDRRLEADAHDPSRGDQLAALRVDGRSRASRTHWVVATRRACATVRTVF